MLDRQLPISTVREQQRWTASWVRIVIGSIAAAWLIGYELNILFGPGQSGSVLFGSFAYESVMWAGATLCLIRAAGFAQQRLIWLLAGLGCALWVAADTYYQVVAAQVQQVPIPSPADIGYLGFYPLMFATIVLLARARSGRRSPNQWLDGLAAALAAAAAGAAVGLNVVLSSLGGNAPEVATNLAYPIADLLLLATIAGALAMNGPRRGTPLLRLALGLGLFCIGDISYLIHSAQGTYAMGGWFDVSWPGGMSLIAAAAWTPKRFGVGIVQLSAQINAEANRAANRLFPAQCRTLGVRRQWPPQRRGPCSRSGVTRGRARQAGRHFSRPRAG
jgi:hypothetical protein